MLVCRAAEDLSILQTHRLHNTSARPKDLRVTDMVWPPNLNKEVSGDFCTVVCWLIVTAQRVNQLHRCHGNAEKPAACWTARCRFTDRLMERSKSSATRFLSLCYVLTDPESHYLALMPC
ncbi:unnamed protein product [Merluccius merluccius]